RDPAAGIAVPGRTAVPSPHESRLLLMSMTPEQARWFADTFDKLVQSVGQAVLGKNEVVRLVLTAMMAPGHVLLADAPGTRKTSLARSIAATVQGTSTRIPFTPDLLPSGVTRATIYDQTTNSS